MASSLLSFASRAALLVSLVIVLTAARLPAQLSFSFDYRYDANGFFTDANTWRQTHLEAAGAYVAHLVGNTAMAAITPDSSNSWAPVIFDPANITNTIAVGNISVPADTIIVYAGGTSFASPNTVAYGGPGGGSVPDGSGMDWINTLLYRGNGTYRMPPLGSITFTTDWTWYFDDDPTTMEDFGTDIDFFSEAVHELFHVLGFGTLDTWIGLVDADHGTFTGTDSMAIHGSAVPLDDLRQHWGNDTQSLIYGTTTVQEAAMDPSIFAGERKYATALDVAALRDLGYATAAVPEPAAYAGWLGLVVLLVVVRRRRFRNR